MRFIAGSGVATNAHVAPEILLNGYQGNRITVNGFRMNMKKLAKPPGAGKKGFAIAFDIDVRGDDEVVYDVSRDRIIGKGRTAVMQDFWEAIWAQLRETGIADRLDEETRLVLSRTVIEARMRGGTNPAAAGDLVDDRPQPNADFLRLVSNELPDGPWPKGLHQIVADRLGVSAKSVTRAITTLLTTGAIKKPT